MLNARDTAALTRARDVLKRLEQKANKALREHDPYAPVAGWDPADGRAMLSRRGELHSPPPARSPILAANRQRR